MVKNGFTNNQSDSSLFIRHTSTYVVILLVYVDDLVIISSNSSIVVGCVFTLCSAFAYRDLGSLSFFLGMEVVWDNIILYLSQQHYVVDLLWPLST